MTILLRESQDADIPFLQEMLYEAVFWRARADKPSLEEGLAYPEVSKALADWGAREGDIAVVATVDATPVGASWLRFWTDADAMRGYIDETTPVLVIGVHRDYRRQGIGRKMIAWLVDYAATHAVHRISLSVSQDNHALHLYRQCGFVGYAETGDTLIMVRPIRARQAP